MTTIDLIRTEDLVKDYVLGEQVVHALQGVSVTIQGGEMVTVMGASGSGKSTFMTILGCLDTPTAGRYCLEGRDVSDLDDDELSTIRNQRIGFVFQQFNLLPRLDARSNVELPTALHGHAGAEEPDGTRPRASSRRSASKAVRAIAPLSFRGVSSSAWPSRGPWSTIRACSWPMSLPAISGHPHERGDHGR